MNERDNETHSKVSLILSMLIFGTIGLFRRYIDLPSSVIAMVRGLIGMLFILFYIKISKRKIAWFEVKSNLPRLLITGIFLGINWILLFEAYKYTTVATATLCYYMAPVIVILSSPILLKETLTLKKICCVAVALIGMGLVSGITNMGFTNITELRGILLGLGAAVLYAAVILNNKKLKDIPAFDRTFIQLGVAGISLIPYNLLTLQGDMIVFTPYNCFILLILGIFHTGIAYTLYFGTLQHLNAQTVALYSYIDPIVAILCSAIILQEQITPEGRIGAFLVLGATVVSELAIKRPGRE